MSFFLEENARSGVVELSNGSLRHAFRAMGCYVEILVTGDNADAHKAIRMARERITELENLWSRFIETSEVSLLNRSRGVRLHVHKDTCNLIEHMKMGFEATQGRFDPTLLIPIVRLGYETSLDGTGKTSIIDLELETRGRPSSIMIDKIASEVTLPVGTAIDAGGVGKGLAADLVLDQIVPEFCAGAMLSIGGDVAVRGEAPEGNDWVVSILDPSAENAIGAVHIRQGGIATSSVQLRRFGAKEHHLVDPSTGISLDNGVFGATVVAGTAAWAEIFSKQVMVQGVESLAILDRVGLAALVVDIDGIHSNDSWKRMEVKI